MRLRGSVIFFALAAAGAAQAATSGDSATYKQLEAKIKASCQTDIKLLCGDVTPGEGRIAACLNSKQDQLQPACRTAWVDTKTTISKKIDKTEVAFRKDCGADVQKFCTDVPSGRGRLLDCLSKHKEGLSNSCTQFWGKLDEKLSKFLG